MTSKSITTEESRVTFDKIITTYQEIAKYDRQSNAKLVKDRMRRAVKAGYWVSRPPFGYYIPRDDYMQINRSGLALRGILKQLATDGTKGQFFTEMSWLLGSRYTKITALKIASSPVYYGKLVYEGKLYDGKHEPLISKAEHQTIIKKLARSVGVRAESP